MPPLRKVPAEPHSGPPPHEAAVPPGAEQVDRLFRDHNDALLRFIAAKLGSVQEAKDVAQEAYVRLLRLEQGEAVSYLRAFLFKTAANLALDRLRQRARRRFVVSPRDADIPVFELSPDRQFEGEQALQSLRAALEELPEKCREAFLLYRLDGLSCKEVAQRMQLQERMVWLYVARALEHLRARVHGRANGLDKEGAQS